MSGKSGEILRFRAGRAPGTAGTLVALPATLLSKHPDAVVTGVLALLAIAFCAPFLFGNVLLPADALYTAPPWSAFAAEQGVGTVHNELIADLVLQNYSWKQFIAESYRSGQFPLWNPYLFGGTPFLAAGQYAALYPFSLLFVILPVAAAYGPFAALHLFLGGAFSYLFFRILGISRPAAFAGAVAFEFCGFLVASFVWPMILSAAIWLPLGLAMCELTARHLERGTWNSVAMGLTPAARFVVPIGALAVGMELLAGHLEISFYFLFTLMVYSAYRLGVHVVRTRQVVPAARAGFGLILMVGFGFALAAAQLLPFFELIRENYRIGQVTYDEVIGWALPGQHLLALLVPDVFGNPTHHTYYDLTTWAWTAVKGSLDRFDNLRDYPFWGIKNYVEGAAYVGIAPLILAVVAVIRRRDRFTTFFAVYFAVCLLLAFGTPLYRLIWFIPGVNQLHTPFRWMYPAAFCLVALAALGTDTLVRSRWTRVARVRPPRDDFGDAVPARNGNGVHHDTLHTRPLVAPRLDPWARRLAWLTLTAAFLLAAALIASRLLSTRTLAVVEALRAASSSLRIAFPSAAMLYSYEAERLIGLTAALAVTGLAFALLAWRPRWGAWAIGGAIAYDLFVTFIGFNTSAPARLVQFVPPSIQAIKQDTSLYRITSFNLDDTLRPNSNMLFGLQDIRGYDTVILRDYVEYWRLLEEPSGLLYSMINKLVDAKSLQSPLLDLLGVKYVLTTQNIGLPGWTEVYRGEINVYRNDRVLPRVFVPPVIQSVPDVAAARQAIAAPGFDPRRTAYLESEVPTAGPVQGTATISRYGANRVEIDAKMDGDGYVLLTDTYFPGWRASVDEREVPVVRANGLFRAVPVPAGEHRVVLRYSPFTFQLGGYLSVMGLFAIVLGLAYAGWSVAGRFQSEATTIQRILKNSVAPMVTQLANRFIDLAFAVVVARLLGPAAVGEYAFAVVLIGYFQIFTDFGLGTLLTREVAQDRSRAPEFLANITWLRLGLSAASVPVIIALMAIYGLMFNLTAAGALTIAFFTLSLFPGALSASFSSVFFAYEKMEYPALMTSVATILRVGLGLAVLIGGYGIVGLGFVSLVVTTVTAVIFYRLLSTTIFRPRWTFDLAAARRMWTMSFPLMINNFLSSIFFRIDVLFLKPIAGDLATGYYSTAYKFIDGLNVIPSFFTLAVFPVFSRYAVSSSEALKIGFYRSLKLLTILSLPITVGTMLFAEQIILFFFGEEFAPAIIALELLIWFLPFSYINSITHYVLIAMNQQRFLTSAFVIGVAFNIVANLAVIPTFGYQGAAVVTVLSEIVLMVPFFYCIRKEMGWLPGPGLLLRPALAAAGMGVALWYLRGVLPWPVAMATGPLFYVPLLLLLGGVDRGDVALFKRLAGRPTVTIPMVPGKPETPVSPDKPDRPDE